jgi:hypothetical protein
MNVYFQGSSQAEIRKSYRKLSLILHPDKETGNEKAFMKLTKGDIFVSLLFSETNGRGRLIPVHAWTGAEGSRRLRLPDFNTAST